MNTADIYNKINGIPLTPKCDDLYSLLGAVKADNYSCPNCHKEYDEKAYEIDGEKYTKNFNESRGSTIDGNYWDWDEVHCCKKCGTKYWFRNGAY